MLQRLWDWLFGIGTDDDKPSGLEFDCFSVPAGMGALKDVYRVPCGDFSVMIWECEQGMCVLRPKDGPVFELKPLRRD